MNRVLLCIASSGSVLSPALAQALEQRHVANQDAAETDPPAAGGIVGLAIQMTPSPDGRAKIGLRFGRLLGLTGCQTPERQPELCLAATGGAASIATSCKAAASHLTKVRWRVLA